MQRKRLSKQNKITGKQVRRRLSSASKEKEAQVEEKDIFDLDSFTSVSSKKPPKPAMSIIEACNDPNLFHDWFKNDTSWDAWFAFLKALFGQGNKMTDPQRKIYERCTGRNTVPSEQHDEAWLVIGRRGGKALDLDTEVPTPHGYRRMGDLQTGDYVFGSDGHPVKINYAHPVEHDRPCYRVTFSDGTQVVADKNHEWLTHDKNYRKESARRSHRDAVANIDPDAYPSVELPVNAVDRTDTVVGELQLLRHVGRADDGHTAWLARCSCGRHRVNTFSNLKIAGACRVCNRRRPDYAPRVVTTKELHDTLYADRGTTTEVNHAVPVAPAIDYQNHHTLPVDPYVLGIWLGDGDSGSGQITTSDSAVCRRIRSRGYKISKNETHTTSAYRVGIYGLIHGLRDVNVINNKHIPEIYKTATPEQRWDLLRGLMDSDGYAQAGKVGLAYFYNTNYKLASDVYELAVGLGIKVTWQEKPAKLNGKDCGTVYIQSMKTDRSLFSIMRKAKHQVKELSAQSKYRYITNVERVESRPVRCITVDNDDGLFLITRQHIITHNSQFMSLIAVYLACFFDWRPYLSPGEYANVMIMAADRKQARVIYRYIDAFVNLVPVLFNMKLNQTKEMFEFKRRVIIEIHTASFRTTRGYSVVAALVDEIAFLRNEESSNPDYEILEALRPGMTTIPGSKLICASSPHARKGELWNHYKNYFGVDTRDFLVWNAPTWVMNPKVDSGFIKRKYNRDPASAIAEYGAQFRKDVESVFPEETVDACMGDWQELAPVRLKNSSYGGFVDPSGGSKDSFTLAIAHQGLPQDGIDQKIIVDCIRERRPPFSPDDVVKEFCDLLISYGIYEVYGDRYGGEWPRERFKAHGVRYIVADKTKNDLYLSAIPKFMAQEVAIPNNQHLKTQLVDLERRSKAGGRDSIDHPPKGHDDIANAVAGVVHYAHQREPAMIW